MWLKYKVTALKDTGVQLHPYNSDLKPEWIPFGYIKSIPNNVAIGDIVDVNISDYFLEKLEWI
mgnify:CR=1 FL=1